MKHFQQLIVDIGTNNICLWHYIFFVDVCEIRYCLLLRHDVLSASKFVEMIFVD
jgi:hypothetical protein